MPTTKDGLYSLKPGTSHTIDIDLSSIPEGATPTGCSALCLGMFSCCDHSDPYYLFVTDPCVVNCPIYITESIAQFTLANPDCQQILSLPRLLTDGGSAFLHNFVPLIWTKSLAPTYGSPTGDFLAERSAAFSNYWIGIWATMCRIQTTGFTPPDLQISNIRRRQSYRRSKMQGDHRTTSVLAAHFRYRFWTWSTYNVDVKCIFD
jgi:hypothetical protein